MKTKQILSLAALSIVLFFQVSGSSNTDTKIIIDNENILNTKLDVTTIRKKMGLLAQRPYPLPMSIFKNIAYGLKISNRGK